jgi:hypothetical protein
VSKSLEGSLIYCFYLIVLDPRLGIEPPSDDTTSSPGQGDQLTPKEEPGSLRDKMLKQPDSDNYQVWPLSGEPYT